MSRARKLYLSEFIKRLNILPPQLITISKNRVHFNFRDTYEVENEFLDFYKYEIEKITIGNRHVIIELK